MQIWFTCSMFDRSVHAPALGFTDTVFDFAFAETAEDAKKVTAEYYRDKYGLGIVQQSAKPAIQQNLETYTFPEQIRGLPAEISGRIMAERYKRWASE